MKKLVSVFLAAVMALCAMPFVAYAENSPYAVYKFNETISVFGVIYNDGTGETYYFNGKSEPYTVVADEVGPKDEVIGFLLSLTAQELTVQLEEWAKEMGLGTTDYKMTSKIDYPPVPVFGRSSDPDPDARYEQITDAQYGELITRYDNAVVRLEGHINTQPEPEPLNGWAFEGGVWYYYTDGIAATGWKAVDKAWYYFSREGVMQTGWVKSGSAWYYMSKSGAMVTGWQTVSGKWYYFNASGAMVTGWQAIGGKWYYLNASGAMVTGWQRVGSAWYYLSTSGAMATGWLKSGGSWYYLESSGKMLANTSRKIGSKTYRFNSSGVCTNP